MKNPMAQVYKMPFLEIRLTFRRLWVEGAQSFGSILTEMCYLYRRPRLSDSYIMRI